MLAAIAIAVPLPNLSLISLATWSHTSCLREEITTLAPCSAIRSAIARPMPRVEPVMTATFPDISNRLMSLSRCWPGRTPVLIFHSRIKQPLRSSTTKASSELFLRHDLRPRRLMHRVVRGVRDPWLLVDHRKPPDRMAVACDMVEPRHRNVVDVEGEAFVGLAAERQTDRGPDRSAMRHRDHVPARLLARDALDGAAGAVVEIPETLAAGRGLVERGKPVTAGRQARHERRAIHALQLAEMLLGESLFVRHRCGLGKSGGPDRVRG